MGEAWGGHLSTGLDVGRQRQNRPTTAALARLERSRRAGIITRAPEAFSMPLDSSIGRRRQELVIESWGCEFALDAFDGLHRRGVRTKPTLPFLTGERAG